MDAPTTTEARVAARPAALAFDGLTKNFKLTAGGQYEAVHPIDARYFQILRTAVGSIRSAPNTGQGISNLKYIDPLTIDAYVRDQVRLVSADMVAAKEIRVLNVTIALSVRGRIAAQVDYENLKSGARKTASL